MQLHDSFCTSDYDPSWRAVVHGDCYITITVYLHKPPLPQPLGNAYYVMITPDHGSPSMIKVVETLQQRLSLRLLVCREAETKSHCISQWDNLNHILTDADWSTQ